MTDATADPAPEGLRVWFDAEYTTLDLERAHLLQVAAVITDGDLRRVLPAERDLRLALRLPATAEVSPWVAAHLAEQVAASRSEAALEPGAADGQLARYVDDARAAAGGAGLERPVLAGNSVHADWWLARRFLPVFLGRLHYRHLDVTALKLEWFHRHPGGEFRKEDPARLRAFFPGAVLPPDGARHDAYYDVQASIAELAFYRANRLAAF